MRPRLHPAWILGMSVIVCVLAGNTLLRERTRPSTAQVVSHYLCKTVNGIVEGPSMGGYEQCDDGNVRDNDGCTYCRIDKDYTCVGSPSRCWTYAPPPSSAAWASCPDTYSCNVRGGGGVCHWIAARPPFGCTIETSGSCGDATCAGICSRCAPPPSSSPWASCPDTYSCNVRNNEGVCSRIMNDYSLNCSVETYGACGDATCAGICSRCVPFSSQSSVPVSSSSSSSIPVSCPHDFSCLVSGNTRCGTDFTQCPLGTSMRCLEYQCGIAPCNGFCCTCISASSSAQSLSSFRSSSSRSILSHPTPAASPVVPVAAATLTLTYGGPSTVPGIRPAIASFAVRNIGSTPSEETLLRIHLTYPTYSFIAEQPDSRCFVEGADLTCDLGTMAAGASATVWIALTPSSLAICNSVVFLEAGMQSGPSILPYFTITCPSSSSSLFSSRSSVADIVCPIEFFCGAKRNPVTDACVQVATTAECGPTGMKMCNGPSCLSDGCASQCCACLYPVSSSSGGISSFAWSFPAASSVSSVSSLPLSASSYLDFSAIPPQEAVVPGGGISYDLTMKNNGPSPDTITIDAVLPPGTVFEETPSIDCLATNVDGDRVTCAIPVNPWEVIQFSLRATTSPALSCAGNLEAFFTAVLRQSSSTIKQYAVFPLVCPVTPSSFPLTQQSSIRSEEGFSSPPPPSSFPSFLSPLSSSPTSVPTFPSQYSSSAAPIVFSVSSRSSLSSARQSSVRSEDGFPSFPSSSSFCGNRLLEGDEQCEAGFLCTQGMYCSNFCRCVPLPATIAPSLSSIPVSPSPPTSVSACGNGTLETGEECEVGFPCANGICGFGCRCGDSPPASSSSLIATAVDICGNGLPEAGEQCDDGNTIGGDGCSALCTMEHAAAPSAPVCGNGILEAGEQCEVRFACPSGTCDLRCQCNGRTSSPSFLSSLSPARQSSVRSDDGSPSSTSSTSASSQLTVATSPPFSSSNSQPQRAAADSTFITSLLSWKTAVMAAVLFMTFFLLYLPWKRSGRKD